MAEEDFSLKEKEKQIKQERIGNQVEGSSYEIYKFSVCMARAAGGGDRMLALVKEEKGKTDILWTAKV